MKTSDSPQKPAAKRPYKKPTLAEYGSLTKLTQNGTGSGVDGNPAGGMAMMCL